MRILFAFHFHYTAIIEAVESVTRVIIYVSSR